MLLRRTDYHLCGADVRHCGKRFAELERVGLFKHSAELFRADMPAVFCALVFVVCSNNCAV